MTLAAEEFIRRFLIHVLAKRFMKIKHYGLLSNRNKASRLAICKRLTHTKVIHPEKLSTIDLVQKIIGRDLSKCPQCASTKLRLMSIGRSPPLTAITA